MALNLAMWECRNYTIEPLRAFREADLLKPHVTRDTPTRLMQRLTEELPELADEGRREHLRRRSMFPVEVVARGRYLWIEVPWNRVVELCPAIERICIEEDVCMSSNAQDDISVARGKEAVDWAQIERQAQGEIEAIVLTGHELEIDDEL